MSRIWVYQIAVFLSAFLFFQIQPMTSSALLPLFGGSYLVWGVCMVFYQAVLLLGYLYVHSVHRWLGVVRYSRLHWILLLLPLLAVSSRFIMPGEWMTGTRPLAVSIVGILALTVGVPVFALSTTSLMLQKWLLSSDLAERTNPYVLYSGSNLGSMLGLLTYPVLVEPFLTLESQWHAWLAGYLCVVGMHAFCMPSRKNEERESVPAAGTGSGLTSGQVTLWFLLSAAGTALLLAVTNVITLDLASIPFLWILPLSVYLFAYVLTFKQKAWYPAWWSGVVYWAVILGILLHITIQLRMTFPVPVSILLYMFILFSVCLACSGELIRSKPADTDRNLTTFYLVLAAGGLAGSLVVAWIIPLVSKSLVEFPLALVAAMLTLALCAGRVDPVVSTGPKQNARAAANVILCGTISALSVTLLPWLAVRLGLTAAEKPLLLIIAALPVAFAARWVAGKPWQFAAVLAITAVSLTFTEDIVSGGKGIRRVRNFYGIYKLYDSENMRYLQHGTTLHGRQYITGPKAGVPLSYFHKSGPAGGLLSSTNFTFRNIGMIGLGTGALAAYAGEGQTFKVFELDPDNIPIAENNFIYLKIAREHGADVSFVTGDGRISLRRQKEGSLDLLVIDAFNSGSIPVHLLTVEALWEYFRVLGKDGLLLMHISNRFMDLAPVVYSNARMLGAGVCEKTNAGNVDPDAQGTQWVVLCHDPGKIDLLVQKMGWVVKSDSQCRPWTDGYSNVLGAVLRFSMGSFRSL